MKIKKILPICTLIVSIAINIVFAYNTSFCQKLLVKFGIHDLIPLESALYTRHNMLSQMNYDSDVVFLGDSITANGDFASYLNDKKVVNLGVHSETLKGMENRIIEIKSVNPEKIFIMGGINSLSKYNLNDSINCYKSIVENIKKSIPNAQIYIQSVLPISKNTEDFFRDNSTIIKYNEMLKNICKEYNIDYIDIYSLYVKDGQMNEKFSDDGVHPNKDTYSQWCDYIHDYIY